MSGDGKLPLPAGEWDAIVVGSGAGGSTVARELTLRGQRVLLLERGGNQKSSDSLRYLASVSDYVPIGDGIGMGRAITTGGTTSLYFGVAEYPPLKAFLDLGVDLSTAVEDARRELPLVEPLSDRLLGLQVQKVRDSARAIGVPWVKTESMMINEAANLGQAGPESVWRATQYIDEGIRHGLTLVNHAKVSRVLMDGGRVTGVEYELRVGRRREQRVARAGRVVMAAGALATPGILRASGLVSVAQQGFYSDPGYLVMGHVPGLKGDDLLPGCMGTNIEEDGLLVGDGCLPKTMYRGFMLSSKRFVSAFRHRSHVAVAVMVRDGRAGSIDEKGRFHKNYTREETQKLEKGGQIAERILAEAGAKGVFRSDLSAAHVGGLLQIGLTVDADLQTEVRGLHVCDCSILPDNVRLTPVFSLVCLGKYLAGRLAA